uniref:Protein FAR1-RELATED SEQUENCE n=1 Tax=Arundo donax TaxID=35708 RepID=A0A0A9I062_ARUDO
MRYNTLSRMSAELSSEGATNTQKFNYLVEGFEKLKEGMKAMDVENEVETQANIIADQNGSMQVNRQQVEPITNIHLKEPEVANTKGRPLSAAKRMKPIAEEKKQKKKQKYDCSHCHGSDHNITSCKFKHVQFDFGEPKRATRGEKNPATRRGTKNGVQIDTRNI